MRSESPRPLVWLHSEIRTPPFSKEARLEAGFLLQRLQEGESLPFPYSRPMPGIGSRCHELRIRADEGNWRIFYRTDSDAVVILEVFRKKSRATPVEVLRLCKARLMEYDSLQ